MKGGNIAGDLKMDAPFLEKLGYIVKEKYFLSRKFLQITNRALTC